jgi:hypothetical protein
MKNRKEITMRFANRIGAIALTAVMAATAPIAATAQTESAPTAQGVTDSEIVAFAQAYEQVIAINNDFTQRIEGAASDSDRQALMAEAQTAQTQAVESTQGIGVERYVEILTLAQSDPDLTSRIVAALEG